MAVFAGIAALALAPLLVFGCYALYRRLRNDEDPPAGESPSSPPRDAGPSAPQSPGSMAE